VPVSLPVESPTLMAPPLLLTRLIMPLDRPGKLEVHRCMLNAARTPNARQTHTVPASAAAAVFLTF